MSLGPTTVSLNPFPNLVIHSRPEGESTLLHSRTVALEAARRPELHVIVSVPSYGSSRCPRLCASVPVLILMHATRHGRGADTRMYKLVMVPLFIVLMKQGMKALILRAERINHFGSYTYMVIGWTH